MPALGDAYTIERELGGGGMSRVFVATEVALKRRVVVKLLGRELAQGLSADRFAREIELAAALQDPHIVPVLATGVTADGLPYFTMPYVEGESLRDRLTRGPVPLDEALRILRDVAEALEYAHARGVVHRDIKPENILLSGRSAVVADFGIAKAVSAARASGAPANATLTSAGTSLGTPGYMAPEQVSGDPTDQRSDIYSWGVVAYELLAGAHPFAHHTSAQQLMAAHITEAPRLLDEQRPGLPPSLGALVMRCLAKLPAERPDDAAAVLSRLGSATTDLVLTSGRRSPVGSSAGRSRLARAAVALAVLAGGAGWWAMRGRSASAAGASASATPSLAVLPFEHRGDSTESYITEGLTDELRGKLAGVRELTVIARASSNQYRGSRKSPAQIAEELGVRWLLTATVQVVGSGAERRVIVRPELVEVGDNGIPKTTWGEAFDATGADALKIQGQIAGNVVDAMQVALVGDDRARTVAVPTKDPAAYDAYLRGRAATEWGGNSSPEALTAAIRHFEAAVRRDSALVEAWIGLTSARGLLFANARAVDTSLARGAREAAARVQVLAPGSAAAMLARAYVSRQVERQYDSARVYLERGGRLAPSDFRFSGNLALLQYQNLGEARESLRHFERARALDPRSASIAEIHARALIAGGLVEEARVAADRALALSPMISQGVQTRVRVELTAGDTTAARRLLLQLAPGVMSGRPLLELAAFAGWLLDEPAAIRALSVGPEVFGGDRAAWNMRRAMILLYRADTARAHLLADSARRLLRPQATSPLARPNVLFDLGLAEAMNGSAAAAIAAASRGLQTIQAERSRVGAGMASAYFDAATIAAQAGARDSAFVWLAIAGRMQAQYTGARVAVDPAFASLRTDPRWRTVTEPTAR
jgi:serine/threonine-protein kinase